MPMVNVPVKPKEQSSTKTTTVAAKLPAELVERIDAWRASQDGNISRQGAVKRLLIAHFWPNL